MKFRVFSTLIIVWLFLHHEAQKCISFIKAHHILLIQTIFWLFLDGNQMVVQNNKKKIYVYHVQYVYYTDL